MNALCYCKRKETHYVLRHGVSRHFQSLNSRVVLYAILHEFDLQC